MILDIQIHLWEADRPDRPYVAGITPGLPAPFGPAEILPLMDSAGVDRAIIVPPSLLGFDNDFALECAATYPDRFRVMGRIAYTAPDAAGRIAHWLDQPGMVGCRIGVTARDQAAWTRPDIADPFFRAASDARVPVAMFVPGNVQAADAIADRFPELILLLDHLGLPHIDSGFDYPDVPRMLAMARHPNVWVKLSTLASRSLTGYPFRETHDLVRRAYDAFGPKRLLWGTDHTQQLARGRSRYVEEVDLIREAVDFLTDEERRWILGENAAQVLRWP